MSGDIQDGFLLPPDKSILHRLLIIGSLSRAEITVPLYSRQLPDDIKATIECLQALGVKIDWTSAKLRISGVGVGGWKAPSGVLNCHNSGTTARLLTGALCGQAITATLVGDESLSKRPMARLTELLNTHFGAKIHIDGEDGLPLTITGRPLHPADIFTPVASAQLKSSVLLAALHTAGVSTVREPSLSRDHTERMLQAFGVEVESIVTKTILNSTKEIPLSDKIEYEVPCDISAVYYLIVAAILQKKACTFTNVLLNPTRTKFLDLLSNASNIKISNQREQWNEMRGDISVYPTEARSLSFRITKADVPLILDELPLIAVLAAFFEGQTVVENAEELRYKESDRIKLSVTNLRNFGVRVGETAGGFIIDGNAYFVPNPSMIEHGNDHRIAMAFGLMATKSAVTIHNPSVVNVSFPGYFTELEKIIGKGRIQFN